MRAVTRRKAGSPQPILSNGRLSLDPATREASCDGAGVRLTGGNSRSFKPCSCGRAQSCRGLSSRVESMAGARRSKATPSSPDPFATAEAWRGCDPKCQGRRMAGRKGDVSQSLQFRLFLWLSAAIVLVAVPAGFLSYWYAFREAIELQDDQLRQTAAWAGATALLGPLRPRRPDRRAQIRSRGCIVLTAGPQGPWLPAGAEPGLSASAPDGLQTVAIGGAPWQFVISSRDRGLRIAVGQQTAVRNEIANKSALRAVAPLLTLIALLPLVIGATVRRMLRPLKRVAENLESSSEADWSRFPMGGCRSRSVLSSPRSSAFWRAWPSPSSCNGNSWRTRPMNSVRL